MTMSKWWDKQIYAIRRVWRYQRANQKPYIEEEQTTQWPKEKLQKDKQRSIYVIKLKECIDYTLSVSRCYISRFKGQWFC